MNAQLNTEANKASVEDEEVNVMDPQNDTLPEQGFEEMSWDEVKKHTRGATSPENNTDK